MDQRNPVHPGSDPHGFADTIEQTYRAIDREIGEMIALAGDRTRVMVFALHAIGGALACVLESETRSSARAAPLRRALARVLGDPTSRWPSASPSPLPFLRASGSTTTSALIPSTWLLNVRSRDPR
jgi:hypothetical protein